MKTRYETRNSVYEVERTPEGSRIRRVSGDAPPLASFGEDGVWQKAHAVLKINFGTGEILLVHWPEGGSSMTSYVTREEAVE